jgi:hypothetical protein
MVAPALARTLWSALVMTAVCLVAEATESSLVVYDRDPGHLWNRLYGAIAARTGGDADYGMDNSEPYHESFDNPEKLVAILDEFREKHGEDWAPDPLRRALLQNDVWAAFDLATGPNVEAEGASLRRDLARVIRRLRLQSSQISSLPDNYAQAVKSAAFATDFDPEHPDSAFLPPDLLDGGRQATLSYLETLNLYLTPWALKPADIATQYPSRVKVRWNPLRFDPATPQFPAGTIVALVRQMMVINEVLKPVTTSITQKVQFRVFKDIGKPGQVQDFGEFNNHQLVYELVMRRRDILAGRAGGFHPVTQDETEYQLTTILEGGSREARLRGPVVLATCVRCHSLNGIFSVNTYSGFLNGVSPASAKTNPQLLPGTSIGYQARATSDWKMSQFDWGLLRGLLEADR